MGYHTVCDCVQKEFFLETGIKIPISHSTLQNWVAGKRTHAELVKQQQWLLRAEERSVVAMCIKMALRGFPWSHCRLKEHVDLICIMKYGGEDPIRVFPDDGVGVNWTAQ
ncbi:hypothetical protein BJ165DRAFT_1340031 [Panaeolus papilionaceus]|nr:hypothetical protein BJ165DRAFT_1340031 [Panaeolus papilionaceus]